MPTTSSYYTDLEYPTVNQDGDTWGILANEYLDGLLTKLKNLSDRINSAGVGSDSDLSQILRDISQYENINASIPTTVKSLFGITDLKAADTYSYATAWNASYDSYLQGFSLVPPGSAAAVQSFDYDLLAEKLRPFVTQAENNISQANSDIAHVNAILARLAAGATLQPVYIPIIGDSGVSGQLTITKNANGAQENMSFEPDSGDHTNWLNATSTLLGIGAGTANSSDATNVTISYGTLMFTEDGYALQETFSASTALFTITELSGFTVVGTNNYSVPGVESGALTDWTNTAGLKRVRFAFNGQPNTADISAGASKSVSASLRMRQYSQRYLY
jgi:hypothetical protein